MAFRTSRGFATRSWVLLLLLTFLGIGGSAAGAATASSHKKAKPLSLASVVIHGPTTGTSALLWIAQRQNFFKQQGLTVTLDDSSVTSAEGVTLLLTGESQFLNSSAGNEIEAAEAGGSLRAVFMISLDTTEEIAVNASTAAADGIPATATTAAQALAQFEALKGSHLVLGVSNTTADSYNWVVALAKLHGLSIGVGCSTCDINVDSVGSTSNLTAGLASGKLQAISNVPPVTVATGADEMLLYKIPPVTDAASSYLTTSITMIQQHPDTVQAVVNGFTEAMRYAKSHPVQSEKDVAVQFAAVSGVTSPEEQQYLYTGSAEFFTQPYPTKASYNTEINLINAAQTPPINFPWSTFVDAKFVTKAIKLYP